MLWWQRRTVVSLLAIVLMTSPLIGQVAAEDEDDETVAVPIAGYQIGATLYLDFGVWIPNTPIPSQRIESIFAEDYNLTIERQKTHNACQSDDEFTDQDLVSCEYQETLSVVAPCGDLLPLIREIPIVGPALESTARSAVQTADQTLASDIIWDNVEALGLSPERWDGDGERLFDNCEGRIQSVSALAGVERIEVDLSVIGSVTVCPFPAIPELPCESVPVNEAINEGLNETANRIITNDCTFTGLSMDCGRYNLTGHEFDPFEPERRIVDEIPNGGNVTTPKIDQHDQNTTENPYVRWQIPLHSLTYCDTAGLPSGPPGRVSGGPFPVNIGIQRVEDGEEEDDPMLTPLANTFNEMVNEAAAQWNETNYQVAQETSELWKTAMRELLGSDEGGQVSGTQCESPHVYDPTIEE